MAVISRQAHSACHGEYEGGQKDELRYRDAPGAVALLNGRPALN